MTPAPLDVSGRCDAELSIGGPGAGKRVAPGQPFRLRLGRAGSGSDRATLHPASGLKRCRLASRAPDGVGGTIDMVREEVADPGLAELDSLFQGCPVPDPARLTPLGALDFSRRLHALDLEGTAHEPLSGAQGLGERLYSALSILAAAEAWGAASRALDMAVEYAGVRRQFGRPIGSFQALKHQVADMAVETAPARFLVWRAARAWDATSSSWAGANAW